MAHSRASAHTCCPTMECNIHAMAERATKRSPKRRESVEVEPTRLKIVEKPSSAKDEVTALQYQVIQMLARGRLMPDIARKFQHQLAGHEPDPQKRLKKARIRVRKWMGTQKFRDLLWEESVIGLDLETPLILNGVSRKAQAGRIDAARLALEITGRHAPNAEVTPASININFGGVPRPRRTLPTAGELVDPDEEVEDAEWEEA